MHTKNHARIWVVFAVGFYFLYRAAIPRSNDAGPVLMDILGSMLVSYVISLVGLLFYKYIIKRFWHKWNTRGESIESKLKAFWPAFCLVLAFPALLLYHLSLRNQGVNNLAREPFMAIGFDIIYSGFWTGLLCLSGFALVYLSLGLVKFVAWLLSSK